MCIFNVKLVYLKNGESQSQGYILITNRKSHIAYQITRKALTLDDLESQYCNRNCVGSSASSLATAKLLVFRGFRLRHIGLVQHWIVPKLLHGMGINQENMHMTFQRKTQIFYHLSFDLLGLRSPPYGKGKFGQGPTVQNALLIYCTLHTDSTHTAAPMLSQVM